MGPLPYSLTQQMEKDPIYFFKGFIKIKTTKQSQGYILKIYPISQLTKGEVKLSC